MSEKRKRLEKEQMIDVITRTALRLEAKLLVLHDSYNIYHKNYSPEALELYSGFSNYSDAVHRMIKSGQLGRLPSELLKKLLEYTLDVSERLDLGVRMPTNQKKSKGDEIQSDIDGNKNGNLYAYGANNPVHYIDPTGLENEDYYKSDWISGIPSEYRNEAQKYIDSQNARHKENIQYMAQTIYGESRGENKSTKTAIGWSIRNRADIKLKSVKSIVTKRAQYSCWNRDDPNYEATTNSEEHAKNNGDLVVWQECLTISKKVLESNKADDPTQGATHYYDKSMDNRPPIWASIKVEPNLQKIEVNNVQNIRFFKGVRF